MGLEAFNTSRDHAVGDVKSRKNIENLTIAKEGWEWFIGATGGEFPIFIINTEEGEGEEFTNEELKAVIKMYDQHIEDEEFFGYEEGSDEVSQIRDTREDLVDLLKERKA